MKFNFDINKLITIGGIGLSAVGAVFVISKIPDVSFKVALEAIGIMALIIAAMGAVIAAMAGLRKVINDEFGKDGEDKIIEVPCGTVVHDAETGEFICDVTEDGQEVILLKALLFSDHHSNR